MKQLNEIFDKIFFDKTDFLIYNDWSNIVGQQLYKVTEILRINKFNMVVGVKDNVWISQLIDLRYKLLKKINQRLKHRRLTNISFVIKKDIDKEEKQFNLRLKKNNKVEEIHLTKDDKKISDKYSENIEDPKLRENFKKLIEYSLKRRKYEQKGEENDKQLSSI